MPVKRRASNTTVSSVIDPADGLPAMRVGEWALRKHALIGKYAEAARLARKQFPHRCYVDLFCGPGRVYVERTMRFEDGSALTAWRASAGHEGAFTDLLIGDIDGDFVRACEQRLGTYGAPVRSFIGPAEETIEQALRLMPPNGLHLALLDPFNLANLKFDLIRRLSTCAHVDIVVHFSANDLKRNLELDFRRSSPRFDAVAPGWRNAITPSELAKWNAPYAFIDYWRSLIGQLGLTIADEAPDFVNSRNGLLYWLFLLYRHPLAGKLWDSFRNTPTRDLF